MNLEDMFTTLEVKKKLYKQMNDYSDIINEAIEAYLEECIDKIVKLNIRYIFLQLKKMKDYLISFKGRLTGKRRRKLEEAQKLEEEVFILQGYFEDVKWKTMKIKL